MSNHDGETQVRADASVTDDDERQRFDVVCCLALGDAQAAYHLMPIALCDNVRTMWIVRPRPLPGLDSPKVRYVLLKSRVRAWRLLCAAVQCFRLARRPDVRLLVSFNPFPYGLIALFAGKLTGKRVHCGFVGSDWHIKLRRPWVRRLLPILRSAWLTTVPGTGTLEEAVQAGFSRGRIVTLPHAIDLTRFPVAPAGAKEFSCLFVGRLVAVKRVDLILDALEKVSQTHPHARFLIVGDGPLRPALMETTAHLNLSDRITFAGHQEDVSACMRTAQVILFASDSEGLPFALVEGLCTGLIPVATAVGSIPDFIIHEHNGLLVSRGNAAELASAIRRLLDDSVLFHRLRTNILSDRERFGYDRSAEVWARYLARLLPPRH